MKSETFRVIEDPLVATTLPSPPLSFPPPFLPTFQPPSPCPCPWSAREDMEDEDDLLRAACLHYQDISRQGQSQKGVDRLLCMPRGQVNARFPQSQVTSTRISGRICTTSINIQV
jgi:hypothetical protein